METVDARKGDATGEIAVMGASGDTKHYWNKTNWAEVEAAKATFDLYKGKGFRAFRMDDKGGAEGEQVNEFDPSAGQILFLVPMAGG